MAFADFTMPSCAPVNCYLSCLLVKISCDLQPLFPQAISKQLALLVYTHTHINFIWYNVHVIRGKNIILITFLAMDFIKRQNVFSINRLNMMLVKLKIYILCKIGCNYEPKMLFHQFSFVMAILWMEEHWFWMYLFKLWYEISENKYS